MLGPRGIDLALDLARMPALAKTLEKPALPADIFDVMQIAAGSPEACQWAAQETGQPAGVLVDAARFYLQQVLLRPNADPYRVLGLPPGASREVARRHLGCLLQWLHPDVNTDWDSVYAERVLKAWREISANKDSSWPLSPRSSVLAGPGVNSRLTMRMPWIEQSRDKIKAPRKRARMPVGKPVVALAAAAFVVAVLVAVYAIQLG